MHAWALLPPVELVGVHSAAALMGVSVAGGGGEEGGAVGEGLSCQGMNRVQLHF